MSRGAHGIDIVRFTGVNVQIVNGTGVTNTTNSARNLFIGYGETTIPNDGGVQAGTNRTGSHSIMMGEANAFSAVAGPVNRNRNSISANVAMVLSGRDSLASGLFAVVVSGNLHQAVGGSANIASDVRAVVVGGANLPE